MHLPYLDANQPSCFTIQSKGLDKKSLGRDHIVPPKECEHWNQSDWTESRHKRHQKEYGNEDDDTHNGHFRPENSQRQVILAHEDLAVSLDNWIIENSNHDKLPQLSYDDDTVQDQSTDLYDDPASLHKADLKSSVPQNTKDTVAAASNEVGTSRSDQRRRVSFGLVHVRVHELVLGDHPDSQRGPSIGIGWHYEQDRTYSLKYWESRKQRPRQGEALVHPTSYRVQLLREWGYLQKDIDAAVRAIDKVRRQRRTTIQNLAREGFEERVERFLRLLKPRFWKRRTVTTSHDDGDGRSSSFARRSSLKKINDADVLDESRLSSIVYNEA